MLKNIHLVLIDGILYAVDAEARVYNVGTNLQGFVVLYEQEVLTAKIGGKFDGDAVQVTFSRNGELVGNILVG